MCVRVLSEQNESLINAGLAEVSLQEFFISHNMRDDRLVNFTSQFLKAFFLPIAGHVTMRDMQENHAGTCRKTLLILAGMDITTFVPVQACRTITAGLHECILFVTRAGPTTLFRPILKKEGAQ